MTDAPAPADIPVVILAGGMGTRLREETERLPKPLVTIGEQPILWHIMKLYRHHGFRRFVLCLGYKSWLIKEYFLRYAEMMNDFTVDLGAGSRVDYHPPVHREDWQVTCVETGLYSGTGTRLARAERFIDTDTFLFTYGDGLGDVDLGALLEFHRGHDRLATVTGVRPTSRYGEMRVEGDAVVEFNEKPTTAEGLVSGGFFVLDRGVFDYVDADDPDVFFELEPLQRLARDGQLAVRPHEGFWLGMDTYRDFATLNGLWEREEAPWKVWPT